MVVYTFFVKLNSTLFFIRDVTRLEGKHVSVKFILLRVEPYVVNKINKVEKIPYVCANIETKLIGIIAHRIKDQPAHIYTNLRYIFILR